MNTSAPIKWVLPVMLAGVLGGCLNTSPVADNRRFFVIEPGPSSFEQTAVTNIDHRLGIKPILVPAYLRDYRIVVRQSSTEIGYSETVRWGEPISLGLLRVIRGSLDTALEDVLVAGAPWQRGDVDFEVSIRFQRCEVDISGLMVIDAEWLCSKVDDPTTVVFGQDHIDKQGPRPSEDPSGAVTTLSEAVHELSLQIAETVRACINGAKESP